MRSTTVVRSIVGSLGIVMKTKAEIKTRIAELFQERDWWHRESATPAAQEDPDGYGEYCRQNAAQFSFQINGLKWVLELPLIP